ncbi:MAG TPA: hypothetical protein PLT65_00700 [Bacilli bacterium]|nr:hypothetical protein [Bacilli bacterium]
MKKDIYEIANKLQEFAKDFDFYEYSDCQENEETDVDVANRIYNDLLDSNSREKIEDYLIETASELKDEIVSDFLNNYNRDKNIYTMSDSIKTQYDFYTTSLKVIEDINKIEEEMEI